MTTCYKYTCINCNPSQYRKLHSSRWNDQDMASTATVLYFLSTGLFLNNTLRKIMVRGRILFTLQQLAYTVVVLGILIFVTLSILLHDVMLVSSSLANT